MSGNRIILPDVYAHWDHDSGFRDVQLYPAVITVRDNEGHIVDRMVALDTDHAASLLEGLPDGWHAETD